MDDPDAPDPPSRTDLVWTLLAIAATALLAKLAFAVA